MSEANISPVRSSVEFYEANQQQEEYPNFQTYSLGDYDVDYYVADWSLSALSSIFDESLKDAPITIDSDIPEELQGPWALATHLSSQAVTSDKEIL